MHKDALPIFKRLYAIISRYELAPRKHTQLILPMLDSILAEAGVSKSALDAIAFGRGPGAFTGLRIAVGVAQGLALALDKPVIPVSTLAAMAQQVLEVTSISLGEHEIKLVPAIDARMGEVYWGQYINLDGEVCLVNPETISKPETLSQFNQAQYLRFGTGWKAYHSEFMTYDSHAVSEACSNVFPSAHYIAKLAASGFNRGDAIDAADAEPAYLRNDVAKKKADQGKST